MPPRSNLRRRAVTSKPSQIRKATRNSTRQPRKAGERTGTRLKLVLSGSSSSSKASIADTEEEDDDLMLSGEELQEEEEEEEEEEEVSEEETEDQEEDSDDEDEDEELALESSPIRLSPRRSSGKLQLKIPKLKLPQSSSSSNNNSLASTDADDDEDMLDDDNEVDDSFDEEEAGPDLSKMTARQKAKLEQESRMYMDVDEVIPSAKKKPELTEEEILKRAEKSRRRKLQQDQKMEEHKQATIQRLLQKQGAKSKKMKLEQVGEDGRNMSVESFGAALERQEPFQGCRYTDSRDATCLLITNQKAFEQVFAPAAVPKAKPTCSAPGCRNPKKYTHAKVNQPVCSLQCYKLIGSHS